MTEQEKKIVKLALVREAMAGNHTTIDAILKKIKDNPVHVSQLLADIRSKPAKPSST